MAEFLADDLSRQVMEDIPISTVDSPSVVLELIYQLKIKDVMNTALITAKKGKYPAAYPGYDETKLYHRSAC